ncbi:MAG: hypothetical protein AAGI11_12825 [Pseudomonadota bacterium]
MQGWQYGYDLSLGSHTGGVVEFMRISDYSEGDQACWFIRFLHTGKAYGFVVQTIALQASISACLLVYNGLAPVDITAAKGATSSGKARAQVLAG